MIYIYILSFSFIVDPDISPDTISKHPNHNYLANLCSSVVTSFAGLEPLLLNSIQVSSTYNLRQT